MTNDINNSQLLMQMRSMSDLAAARQTPLAINNDSLSTGQLNSTNSASFGSLLSSALQQVNQIQGQAGALKDAFISGQEGVDLAQVMIASEKASVAFGATIEIRNKLLKAYEEVKNIRV